MNQPPENEPTTVPPVSDDPNSWLSKVKLLLERSAQACHQIIAFNKRLIGAEHHSADEQLRFNMLPTEMVVAMHNLRVGIEEALLCLATIGLPPGQKEKAKDLFIDTKQENESTDLTLLFQRVVWEGGPQGFLPVAKVKLLADFGVGDEEYQGTLDFLKEMASKYQQYDFTYVPKAMASICRKGEKISDPFIAAGNQGDSCSHLQNSQSSPNAEIDPEEVIQYQKMCRELIEDANVIYGQFCAVGSIYLSAISHSSFRAD